MSGYRGGSEDGGLGRRVDPAWVAWAEEQTVKLLTARRQLQELSDEAPSASRPAEDDPIRMVNEIRLDETDADELPDAEQSRLRVEERPDGRRFVVRVRHENLVSRK